MEYASALLTPNEACLAPYADPHGACIVTDSVRQRYWICSEDMTERKERRMEDYGAIGNIRFSPSGRYMTAGIKDGALVLDTAGERKPLVIRGFFRDDDGFEDSYARRGVPDRSDVKTAVSPDDRESRKGLFSRIRNLF